MANRDYLNIEDELDDQLPYSSITDRSPLEDVSLGGLIPEQEGMPAVPPPNHVRDVIKQRTMGSPPPIEPQVDPLMKEFETRQADLDQYRQSKLQSDSLSNFAQAASQAAMGSNTPKSDDALYTHIQKQGSDLLKGNEEDLDRRQKMINAIEARNLRVDTEEGRREDRNLLRKSIESRKDQARTDKVAAAAKVTDKQADEVQDFDKSIGTMQSVLDQLGKNSEWTGMVDGRVPDAMIGADQVNFRAELGRMVDLYRKLITGAGASNQELKKLEGRLPQPTDTYANFVSKGQGFINAVKKEREGFIKNLQARGKDTGNFAAPKGKIKVTDGKDTFTIDESDLADAEKDGFRRM